MNRTIKKMNINKVICPLCLWVLICLGFNTLAETTPGNMTDIGGELKKLMGQDESAKTSPENISVPISEGKVRFQVLSPTLIRMEFSPQGSFTDAPSVVAINRNVPEVKYTQMNQDDWVIIDTGRLTLRYKLDSGAFTADTLSIAWKDDKGEHVWKPGDKDTQNLGGVELDLDMWQKKRAGHNFDEPGLLSRAGYTLFDDSQTAIWDETTEWVKDRPDPASTDWYFFLYGNDFAHFFKEYTWLTGSVPMIPRWGLGAEFCSMRGYSGEEWKLIAERFREEELPLDILILDSPSGNNIIWAGWDWDLEQVPDPKGFISWMKDRGVRVARTQHYGFADQVFMIPKDDSCFEPLRQELGLPETIEGINLDLADKKQAGLFQKYLTKPMLESGQAFGFMDGTANSSIRGLRQSGGKNVFMWGRHVEYTGMENITGKRAFLLCRDGGWGSHRYPVYFTGDVNPQWSTLDYLVPFCFRTGNAMEPYFQCMFFSYPNLDPELYARLVQLTCFHPSPMFVGIQGMRMPWEYGELGITQYKKFFGLRYRLIPYYYTYCRVTYETGLPLVRGMYVEYPLQEEAYSNTSQYLLGREILLAPAVKPGYGKPVMMDIYLPAGDDWYDYFTGQIYSGGQTISYLCPLDQTPMFIKAGAILPIAPEMDYIDQRPTDPLTLNVYTSKKGAEFKLYEDDGESLDYRKGSFAWTHFELVSDEKTKGRFNFRIHPTEGQYQNQPKQRRYLINIHGFSQPSNVQCNGQNLKLIEQSIDGTGWMWDKNVRVIRIQLFEPIAITQETNITVENAGNFDETQKIQYAIDLRNRLREVKHLCFLKYIAANKLTSHKKSPRCIREIVSLEADLNRVIAGEEPMATLPNFKVIADRVIAGLTDHPFESERVVFPDQYKPSAHVSKLLANLEFQPVELDVMKAILLGMDLRAEAYDDKPEHFTSGHYLHVKAKLLYDRDVAGADAKVNLQLLPPTEGLPGYSVSNPGIVPLPNSWDDPAPAPDPAGDSYWYFDIHYPNEPRPGTHFFKVKATLTWEGGTVEIFRDVEWTK